MMAINSPAMTPKIAITLSRRGKSMASITKKMPIIARMIGLTMMFVAGRSEVIFSADSVLEV